ncbi:MAG: DNA repair and recombination protein RadB [Candidatus Thermoplasmatota archaeon]|jgi:DNA repair protein RadB|nr:DNA repair and recombination protein RadB [Candidatus Thermoplasmatota archaeon]
MSLTIFEMKLLQTRCKPIDDLLGGGIESSTITEVYGEAGSGKTNLCLQVSREYATCVGKVAYIDTEGISLERLRQISEGYDYKKILSNILFFTPHSFEEQEKMIDDALKIKDVGLIVVDTINMLYRLMLEDDEDGAVRSLNRQMTTLQLAARKKDLYVVLSAQVYTAENDDVKPFAGRGIEHIAKTILKFERVGMGKRQVTIIKHRSQPEGKKTVFSITSRGLE